VGGFGIFAGQLVLLNSALNSLPLIKSYHIFIWAENCLVGFLRLVFKKLIKTLQTNYFKLFLRIKLAGKKISLIKSILVIRQTLLMLFVF